MVNRRDAALSLAAALGAGLSANGLAGCSSQAQAAPDVAITLLGGSPQPLSSKRGRVVLINFWATSCTSCVAEMPALASTYERFKAQPFDLLAVAMNYDTPEYVAKFAQTRKLPFGVAFDADGSIAKGFGDIRLTPTTFLIDKQQRIVKRYVGEPEWEALHALIGELLAA